MAWNVAERALGNEPEGVGCLDVMALRVEGRGHRPAPSMPWESADQRCLARCQRSLAASRTNPPRRKRLISVREARTCLDDPLLDVVRKRAVFVGVVYQIRTTTPLVRVWRCGERSAAVGAAVRRGSVSFQEYAGRSCRRIAVQVVDVACGDCRLFAAGACCSEPGSDRQDLGIGQLGGYSLGQAFNLADLGAETPPRPPSAAAQRGCIEP